MGINNNGKGLVREERSGKRTTNNMNYLPNLSELDMHRTHKQSTTDASAEEVFASDMVGYNGWLDKCVALHDTLVTNNVPKNSACGKAPPTAVGNRRKRGSEVPTVECGVDGYKMGVDLESFGERAFLEGYPANVSNWTRIEGNNFAEKLAFVQGMKRSFELLGPDTQLCSYGKNDENQIRVDIYEESGGKESVVVNRTAESIDNETEFAYELISTSEWVYYHPTEAGMVWVHTVGSAEQAAELHLPWPPPQGAEQYMYLPLVCASAGLPGGGMGLMKEVAKLCKFLGIQTLVFSALPHVVWYYYRQLTRAVFLNNQFQEVDVSLWAAEKPFIEPMSSNQADYLRVNFTPRKMRIRA